MNNGCEAASSRGLFIECDLGGRILWMNRQAQLRLGSLGHLRESVPPARASEVPRFLVHGGPPARLSGVVERGNPPTAVPVCFSRLLAYSSQILLIADIHERASDVPSADRSPDSFIGVQNRLFRHFVRLQQIERELAARRHPQSRTEDLIAEAVEREERRLARELHAGAGQALAGIRLHVELIRAEAQQPSPVTERSLESILVLVQEAMTQIRAVSQRLQPPEWQRYSLREAIERLWCVTGIPQRFEADLDLAGLSDEPSHAVRVAAYRGVRECVANMLRHSGATRVALKMSTRGGRLMVRFEDNGRGFDAGAVLDGRVVTGIGLRVMREEVCGLDGDLSIQSGAGGTRVDFNLPLDVQ